MPNFAKMGKELFVSHLLLSCLFVFCFKSDAFAGKGDDLTVPANRYLSSVVAVRAEGTGYYRGKASPIIVPKAGMWLSRRLVKAKAHKNGMGFIVDRSGVIATNAHTLAGLNQVSVILSDGRELAGKIRYTNTNEDFALIDIDSRDNFTPIGFGDSDLVRRGDRAFAVISREKKNEIEMAAAKGVVIGLKQAFVSNERKVKFNNLIKTNILLPYGSSGGPLVDKEGNLIGMNVAGDKTRKISYAIPSNRIKELYGSYLKENMPEGETQHNP